MKKFEGKISQQYSKAWEVFKLFKGDYEQVQGWQLYIKCSWDSREEMIMLDAIKSMFNGLIKDLER